MKANRRQEYYVNVVVVLVVLVGTFSVYQCECKQPGKQPQLEKYNRTLQDHFISCQPSDSIMMAVNVIIGAIANLANRIDTVRHHRARRQSDATVCRDIFRGSSINIASPGYPDNVDDNVLCQWLVIADEEPAILRFHFSTSENRGRLCPNKTNGWIFRDGADPRGNILDPDCRHYSPKVRGISNVISIIFNSSSWVSARAFNIINIDQSASLTTTESVQVTNVPLFTTSDDLLVPPAQQGHGRSFMGSLPIMNEKIGDDGDKEEEEVTDDNSGVLQCFFQESSSSGIISSPDYPERVEGPMCTWIITAFSSEVIQVTISDIDIDGRTTADGGCDEKYSHLKVTTFDQNFNKMEDYYCGRESGDSIVYNSHENFWLEFRSNFGLSRFTSRYVSTAENTVTTDSISEANPEVTEVESDPGCNVVLHDSAGVIQTPNFPNPYTPNLYCVWTILTLPDRLIRLKFDQFDIDGPITGVGKCDISMAHKYSFVKVSYYSINGSLIDETFCGPDNPDVLISDANRLSIFFQSGHGIGIGFQATYTSLSRQQLRGFGRSFGSFDFDTDCAIYMNGTSGNITYNLHREQIEETCSWIIQPSDTSAIIVLTIESLLFRSVDQYGANCENISPPIKIEGISHIDGEPVTWSLCDNVTDTLPIYLSYGQLNVTLNVTLWEIVIFDAYYNLREENELMIEMLTTPETMHEKDNPMSTNMMIPLDEIESRHEMQETTLSTSRLVFEETSSCKNISYATDGWINVHGYPIGSNSICTWTLVSFDVGLIWLSFVEFNLDTPINMPCNPRTDVGSYLNILQTNDTFSKTRVAKPTRYGIFCGSVNPGLLFLVAKEVRLVLRDFDSLSYRDLKLFYSWESLNQTETIPSLVTDEYAATVIYDLATARDLPLDGDVMETKPSVVETSLPTSTPQDDVLAPSTIPAMIGPGTYQFQGESTTFNTPTSSPQYDDDDDVSAPSTVPTSGPGIYPIQGESTTFYTPTQQVGDQSSASTMDEANPKMTSTNWITNKDDDHESSSVAGNDQMSSALIESQQNIIYDSLDMTDAVIRTELFTEIIEEEEAEYVTPETSAVIMSSISPNGTHHEKMDPSCEYRIKSVTGFGQIVSPDYPSSAPPGSKCMWILQFERETKLKILFTEFELSHITGKECELQTSLLRITTWSDQDLELERLFVCGEFSPKFIALQGKTIVIQFWSSPTREDSNRFVLDYFTKRSFYRGLFDGFENSSVTPTMHLTTLQQSNATKSGPVSLAEVGDFLDGHVTSPNSVSISSTYPNVTERRALPESESQFRLTVFVCTGVALVLLAILLVLLILCVRNRNRSSALTLGPEFAAPGDYWSNYRQWARTDYPASVKPYFDVGQPSTSMHPGHVRPVEQERLV